VRLIAEKLGPSGQIAFYGLDPYDMHGAIAGVLAALAAYRVFLELSGTLNRPEPVLTTLDPVFVCRVIPVGTLFSEPSFTSASWSSYENRLEPHVGQKRGPS
jgi:hypothetical protein